MEGLREVTSQVLPLFTEGEMPLLIKIFRSRHWRSQQCTHHPSPITHRLIAVGSHKSKLHAKALMLWWKVRGCLVGFSCLYPVWGSYLPDKHEWYRSAHLTLCRKVNIIWKLTKASIVSCTALHVHSPPCRRLWLFAKVPRKSDVFKFLC